MYLASNSSGWWIFIIVGIFVLIGVLVFVLRKKIPGLVEYDKEDEETIAEDNLSRILMTSEEEEKNKGIIKEETEDEESETKDEE